MERRNFLKGMAFISITPFMPNIPINIESIEVSPLHWASKSFSKIAEDISMATNAIRNSTGFPKSIILPESAAKSIGFNTDAILNEIEKG